MITVGYSTRSHNPEFIEYLKKSSGFKKINVIEKINNGEKSLSEVYNEILRESKTDIVVLCHDDIYFDSSSWFHKIKSHFEKSDFSPLFIFSITSIFLNPELFFKYSMNCGLCSLVEYPTVIIFYILNSCTSETIISSVFIFDRIYRFKSDVVSTHNRT